MGRNPKIVLLRMGWFYPHLIIIFFLWRSFPEVYDVERPCVAYCVAYRFLTQLLTFSSKTAKDRHIVSIKVEQEVICALSNGDIAHNI